MANHLNRVHMKQVSQLKRNAEKYVRTRLQLEYLQECIDKNIIPRSMNLFKLANSKLLWENSNNSKTYDILSEASMNLVKEQVNGKKEKIQRIDSDGLQMKERLRNDIGVESFLRENERIKKHMRSVQCAGRVLKGKKIQRDTEETTQMKEAQVFTPPRQENRPRKKRNRRFKRRQQSDGAQEVIVTNVESADIPSSSMNDHEGRLHGNVKNLSSQELTGAKRELLELGPKFCPVEHDINRARLQKDLNAGFRSMQLREHFYPEEDSRTEEEKRFYVKRDEWVPPNTSAALKTHHMVIQNKFDLWKQPTRVASNMSAQQKLAVKELKEDESIDIKLDDKGGGFVVADSKDYKSSALNDLHNQTNIEEMDPNTDKENIIMEVETEIVRIVDQMVASDEILPSTADFIKHKTEEHKLARYYCKWKCHKYSPTQTEFAAAAVRGIISCSGTPDEKVCDFLDFILNPGMQELRSYLKGTKDFLTWVEKLKSQYPELPPLFGILTIDYKTMYTKMPDGLMLPAVRDYLDSRTGQHKPSTQRTMELLEITRNANYFEFGEKLFKQVGGTSIGKKHAPDSACLGAGKFEEENILPSPEFREIVLDDISSRDEKDRFYKRFIDDMILAVNCTGQQARNFVRWLDTLDPSLKFTFEWSNERINFLDVTLVMEDGKLETDRHVKPTNPQLFLHYTSNHPQSVFKAIVYGQAITVRTICSKQEFVDKHMKSLKEKFIQRGYPVDMVESELARGSLLSREALLRPKPVYPHQGCPVLPAKNKFRPTFIITYNPHNPQLRKWLQEVHFILLAHPKLAKIYPKPPSVSYRQPKNLKQILVTNTLKQLPFNDGSDLGDRPSGCYRHEHGGRGRKCMLCPRLKEGQHFRSTYTGLTYKIRHHLNCKSRFVVYLITCQVCGKQYTGKTSTAMHTRHTGHRNEVENESTELGEHFATCGGNTSMILQIIDCVKEGEHEALDVLEGYWQNMLATFQIHDNINIRNEWRNYVGQQPILF